MQNIEQNQRAVDRGSLSILSMIESPPQCVTGELSIAEAAAVLGVSRRRAAEYVRDGVLAYRQVPGRHGPVEWRVPAAPVRALAAERDAERAHYRALRASGWLTVADVALRIDRSPWTVTRAIHAERVHAVQFVHEAGEPYLIDPADLPAFAPHTTR